MHVPPPSPHSNQEQPSNFIDRIINFFHRQKITSSLPPESAALKSSIDSLFQSCMRWTDPKYQSGFARSQGMELHIRSLSPTVTMGFWTRVKLNVIKNMMYHTSKIAALFLGFFQSIIGPREGGLKHIQNPLLLHKVQEAAEKHISKMKTAYSTDAQIKESMSLIQELSPLCRSATGSDVRTVQAIQKELFVMLQKSWEAPPLSCRHTRWTDWFQNYTQTN